MQLDTNSFELTAKAVHQINPLSRFRDWRELLDYMETCAYCYMATGTSFSTAGFELTGFDASGERHVRASVMAYAVLNHRPVAKSNGEHFPFRPTRLCAV